MHVNQPVLLTNLKRGGRAVITRMKNGDAHLLRLRELGLGEGRTVCVVEPSDPLLCQIDQTRVGVARSLAADIFVRPLPDSIGA